MLPAGRRVAVTGAADLRLAGRTVEILLDGSRVGRAVIGPDGAFAARVAAPSRRRRARARYQARVGTTASQRLRLARRMVATTLTRSGVNLVLRGIVNPPRARRQPAIAVDRFLSCRRREGVKVPKVRPGPPWPLRGADQGARGLAGGALPGADEGAGARRTPADEGHVHAAPRR